MRNRILNYMLDNGSITTLEAFTELNCTRLSEYIRQLRKTHRIADKWVKGTNRYGEKIKYKKYWLEEEDLYV